MMIQPKKSSVRARRKFLAQTLGVSALAASGMSVFAQAKPALKIGFVDGDTEPDGSMPETSITSLCT
jgi:glycine betaine/proline transport system substrate-binding protein